VIEGFTIQNGYAHGDATWGRGGGIYCHCSELSLNDVTIRNNVAQNFGGGIYAYLYVEMYLNNVTINDNMANGGGGISVGTESSLVLNNVTVSNNTAAGSSGGIAVGEYCGLTLNNVTISGNFAGVTCGGLSSGESHPQLFNVVISNNVALGGAGGYGFGPWSSPDLTNVVVSGNYTEGNGGGLLCDFHCAPTLRNVIIADNVAQGVGGGMYCADASPHFNHVTISGNTAGNCGSGICCAGTDVTIQNSVLWNYASQEVCFTESNWGPSSLTISCSDLQGGEAGIETNGFGEVLWLENNIDADPLFCDAENGDYRLQLDSPCRTDVCGFMGYTGETCEGEGVEDLTTQPYKFCLSQNYPNPFNPSTTIEYSLPHPCEVTLSVYNINGQLVDVIHQGSMQTGHHSATWTPSDLPSGVYLVELRAGTFRDVVKVSYVK